MADIFISYAREDVDAAQRLAASLEKRGWSVFWDRHITAGRRYTDVISEELACARCVITLWSRAANNSDWVLDEAEEARKRDILAPARIEALEPPMGFRRIHAADLLGWNGDEKHAGFQRLLLDIAHYVPAPTPRFGGKAAALSTEDDRELGSVHSKLAESPPRPAPHSSHAAGVANAFSARARPRSRLWRGLSGVAFGLAVWFAFFYFPILDRLTYLIPLSVRPLLNPLTAVLFALVGWLWSERQSLAHRWRRVSRVWVFAAPAGVLLLFLFELFVVHFPFQDGLMASEIIAPPRIEGGKCPCTKEESDVACLTSLTLEPEELARCWDGSRRKLYGGLWSLTYLLALSGALLGLLVRPGKVRRPEPAALRPAGGAGPACS